MTNSDKNRMEKRKIAFERIVSVAQRVSAKTVFYFSVLGATSLIVTNTNPEQLPPSLAMAAGGIGINLISNLIDRIANEEKVSDRELETQVQLAIKESGIEQLLTRQEFINENQKVIDLANMILNEVATIRTELQSTPDISQQFRISIIDAITKFLDHITLTHTANTTRGYRSAMNFFQNTLKDHGVLMSIADVSSLDEKSVSWISTASKNYSPATERSYLSAIRSFFNFLAIQKLIVPNIPRFELLIRQRSRPSVWHLPQISRRPIEELMIFVEKLPANPKEDEEQRLRDLRDRAFIITLADTGMRVHEACGIRLGDIDWNLCRVNIYSNDRPQEVIVRLSSRSKEFIMEYLNIRSSLDSASHKPLSSLPLFARHDRGAGKKVKPITTRTGQNIINRRVSECLGPDAVGTITPHSFRHYFVTTVLRASGGNLKLAQELARHKNISVTQRYAHLSDDELDHGYAEIFD